MNVPLYQSVYEELQNRIRSEVYAVGTALPSETKLLKEFGVSLITIRRAIHELVLDGLVDSRQGIGNLVRDPAENAVIVGMSSFTSDVAAGRLRVVRTLMADDLVTATSDVAAKLGVQPGSMLRHFVRLDCEGGVPMSVDEAFAPPSLASNITPEMAASPLFMHLWQKSSGLELLQTNYDITVEQAREQEQRLLQIGPEVPVLVTGELVYDSTDRPVLWVVTRYRGDRCPLSCTVKLVRKKTREGIIGE